MTVWKGIVVLRSFAVIPVLAEVNFASFAATARSSVSTSFAKGPKMTHEDDYTL